MIAILAAVVTACFVAETAWPLVAIPFCFFSIPFARQQPCDCCHIPEPVVFVVTRTPKTPDAPKEEEPSADTIEKEPSSDESTAGTEEK